MVGGEEKSDGGRDEGRVGVGIKVRGRGILGIKKRMKGGGKQKMWGTKIESLVV